ncbi:hypothetical protein ACWIG4_12825 [Streptomyces sp. NPDC002248]
MRTRTPAAATALAALLTSAALTAAPAASADSEFRLPSYNMANLIVDDTHRHLFMTSTGSVLVTTFEGKQVKQFNAAGSPGDMILSPDESALYVSDPIAHTVTVYDTATLTQRARWSIGDADQPFSLALVGDRLWFSSTSGLGYFDLTATQPVPVRPDMGELTWTTANLAADPALPGTLLVAGNGTIGLYDVSGAAPVLRASAELAEGVGAISLAPGGATLAAVTGRGHVVEYRLPGLSVTRTLGAPEYARSVAVAPDGTVAATTAYTSNGDDVFVYPRISSRPPVTRDISGRSDPFGDHTLDWSADGGKLYVLAEDDRGTYVRTLTAPRTYPTTLTASAPAKATRAKSLTIKGTVKSALALPKGTPLKVVRTDLESPGGKTLSAKSLGTGGAFSFTDTPPAGGKVTYKISYAGDADHPAAGASRSVEVSRATPTLKLNNNKKVYAYGADVKFTAHLGSTYKNRTVELWADPYGGDKPNKLVKKAKVNSKGDLTATVDMTRDTTLTAKFTGDSRYAATSVKVTAYAKAKVSLSLSNQYRTGRIGSHTYAYFHKNKDAHTTTTMNYYKGRKQRLDLEIYYNGKWYDGASEYFKLATNGKSLVNLGNPGETGVKARVRAAYVNNSSGDNVNSTAYSPWKYLYFTK